MLYCEYKVAGGFIMRIIHFFNWRLNDIVPNLETVKKQGFDAIQLNPIQPLRGWAKRMVDVLSAYIF